MRKRDRIVVFGILSLSPYAGVAWQLLHYLEGFRRLGYDVYYVDDTCAWPSDADGSPTSDPKFILGYLQRVMEFWDGSNQWVYRSGVDGTSHGPLGAPLSELLAESDILVNLTGSTVLREEHLAVPIRIYLETDPFLPEIEVAQGLQTTIDALGAHTHHFTFGENIGTPHCDVPTNGLTYIPTRQPVVIDWWNKEHAAGLANEHTPYTTVTSWKQAGKDIVWNGDRYLWSKHEELMKFINVPLLAQRRFHAAIATRDCTAIALLNENGWTHSDAIELTANQIEPYRAFVQTSRGEFTVAKDQYVRPLTGWFSDRSASYLAAGRPVITQETGFSRFLPTGRGLHAFRTMDEVVEAIEAIERDYEGSSAAAYEIAREHFAAEKVLNEMLRRL